MHPSALKNAKLFFDNYSKAYESGNILDIGSQDVNGSLKEVAPNHMDYVGVDFVEGKGVDVIIEDPYKLPFEDEKFDIIVSSSCFEHSEMFWLLFLDAIRMLKPNGLLYINAPSNSDFHRWPVDCWRFYPDSGQALVTWAKYNNYNPALLESFTSKKIGGIWNDYIAVYVKEEKYHYEHANRIIDIQNNFFNGQKFGDSNIYNYQTTTDDQSSYIARLKRWYWLRNEEKSYNQVKK